MKIRSIALAAAVLMAPLAQAGAPQVQTQAPGYYRMMLGDFEVTALSDGTVGLHVEKLLHAIVHATRMRLRPILMTSIAFIAGVIPLVLSTGAGAEMRRAMGIAVFSGMLGVTFFGLFLTPVFYVVLRRLTEKRRAAAAHAKAVALMHGGDHA